MSRKNKDHLIMVLEIIIDLCGILLVIWPLVKRNKSTTKKGKK